MFTERLIFKYIVKTYRRMLNDGENTWSFNVHKIKDLFVILPNRLRSIQIVSKWYPWNIYLQYVSVGFRNMFSISTWHLEPYVNIKDEVITNSFWCHLYLYFLYILHIVLWRLRYQEYISLFWIFSQANKSSFYGSL